MTQKDMTQDEGVSLDPTLREFASFTREQLSDMIGDDSVSIARRTRLLWYLRHVHTDAKDNSDGIGLVKKSGMSIVQTQLQSVFNSLTLTLSVCC